MSGYIKFIIAMVLAVAMTIGKDYNATEMFLIIISSQITTGLMFGWGDSE